jgi:hypothetical protein
MAALASLVLLFAVSGCADQQPEAPTSSDQAELKAEQKAAEHRVFYEGWLHPS